MSRRRSAASVPSVVGEDRRAAFEELFRDVYEPLQAYARRRTDLATADDVVAETLLVLWRRFDEIPRDATLAWSYGVARRCLANQRRGEHRRDALAERVEADRAIAPPDVSDMVAEVAGDVQLDVQLTEALAELSVDDREIMRLWAWEELQPREIAVVLAISANAATIRVHRAKQRLSEAFDRKSGVVGGHKGFGYAKETP
ncbi:RNA polymerase sigma factor [soil metagenome]